VFYQVNQNPKTQQTPMASEHDRPSGRSNEQPAQAAFYQVAIEKAMQNSNQQQSGPMK